MGGLYGYIRCCQKSIMSESSTEINEKRCVICHIGFDDTIPDRRCISFKEKGLETLERYCSQREDTELMGHINQSRVSNVRLFVQQKCRRNYTDPKRLKRSLPRETYVPKKKLGSCSSNTFQWKNTCFICGVKCSVDEKYP